MNLRKLFTREATVDATAKRNETDDVLDELAAEEQRTREEQAAQIARERQQTLEYRARVTAEASARIASYHANLDEIGDLVPRLQLALTALDANVTEANAKGLGYEYGGLLEDFLGVPTDFAAKMLAAIKDAAPNTEWDYAHTGPLGRGAKAERPKIRPPQAIRAPRFQGDNAAPPGFSGAWDVLHGRPFVEGGAAPLTFLQP